MMPICRSRLHFILLALLAMVLLYSYYRDERTEKLTSGFSSSYSKTLKQLLAYSDIHSETPGVDIRDEKSVRRVANKYYARNERIRRKFKSSLDKIQSTCLKYATSDNSTLGSLPPNKNFSLGKK